MVGPTDDWREGAAREHFRDVIDAAVKGRPQLVRRDDGQEVVVVSREQFEGARRDLKSVLLDFRFGEAGDQFDQALESGRAAIGAALMPRPREDG